MATGSSLEWDAELGVWVGERAAACDYLELPDPLYVLGYGSLIWRPGNLLENYVSYKCTALGMMRLFAQRSCDHRGTPEFPGLVLNLVEDSVLEELGYRDTLAPQSTFKGLVYLVPQQDTASVIEDLDYRERGGYHRHIIQVQLDDDESEVGGKIVNALVYTGARSNPNFYLPPAGFGCDSTATAMATAHPTTYKRTPSTLAAFNLHRRNIMTDTIAAAVGPSGPNVDYLCNLDRFLNASGMHDPFLTELATSVRLRLGVWRGRLYQHAGISGDHSSAVNANRELLGWGSNEFLQLSNHPAASPATQDATPLTDDQQLEALLAHRYAPTRLSHTLPPVHRLCTTLGSVPAALRAVQAPSHVEHTATTSDSGSSTAAYSSPLTGVEHSYVATGGGTSAVVVNGVAGIWGKLLPELVKHVDTSHRHLLAADPDNGGTSCKYVAKDAAVEGAVVLRQYNQSILIECVQGIAIGHDHMLLLLRRHKVLPGTESHTASNLVSGASPTAAVDTKDDNMQYEDVVVAVGSDSHGQCSGALAALQMAGITVIPQSDLQLTPSTNTTAKPNGAAVFTITTTNHAHSTPVPMEHAPRILKLAVGLRHSAALTSDGRLHTWGDNRHGQVLAGGSWAPLTAPLVDVACGVKYTMLIDALGVAYRLGGAPPGKHSHHVTGHTSHVDVKGVPVRVEGLPANVRWQRVSLNALFSCV